MIKTLIVEDNDTFRQTLRDLLYSRFSSMTFVEARDGKEALQRLSAFSPDLIFMDIQMPKMDGMKATKAIRDEGFDKIPIVAMTAHAMKGDRERCLAAGMDDYITKPIKRESVFEMIDKWVVQKEAT